MGRPTQVSALPTELQGPALEHVERMRRPWDPIPVARDPQYLACGHHKSMVYVDDQGVECCKGCEVEAGP